MELLRAENNAGGVKANTTAVEEQVFCNAAIKAAVMMAQPSSLLHFVLLMVSMLCVVVPRQLRVALSEIYVRRCVRSRNFCFLLPNPNAEQEQAPTNCRLLATTIIIILLLLWKNGP